ncbi:beta-lactamase/transpeptidase-like protein [Favolaschia claudopus]|uniref:Beta-lactamase/transpeptidase-like protein n=1 Tax=Favolaschia claudopus TaxID=2862362 RepID=A0AAW0CNR0_9AGAR
MSQPVISEAHKSNLDQILIDAGSRKAIPALFFGVTNCDGPIYMRAVGNHVVDDAASGQVNEDTLFWLCSMAKLITTIAALQLIEQNLITLDTPVDSILPGLANPVIVTSHDDRGHPATTTPAKGKILFGQLLNHSSGLDLGVDGKTFASGPLQPTHPLHWHKFEEGEGGAKFLEILKGSLPGVPLLFEPGTSFAYGWSIDCVGFIVERLSGKSLEQYHQDHIFSPLGMESLSFYLTPEMKERLLPLAHRTKSGELEPWTGVLNIDLTAALGGTGIYGSLKDYLTILRHLLQIKGTVLFPGSVMTDAILSRASVESMFSPSLTPTGAIEACKTFKIFLPHLAVPPAQGQFGNGLFVNTEDVPGRRRKGTGAWCGWAGTNFFIDPTTGIAAVLGTQILPTGDSAYDMIRDELEVALYAALED